MRVARRVFAGFPHPKVHTRARARCSWRLFAGIYARKRGYSRVRVACATSLLGVSPKAARSPRVADVVAKTVNILAFCGLPDRLRRTLEAHAANCHLAVRCVTRMSED